MPFEHSGESNGEMPSRLMTVSEVAAHLGCSKNNVYALIAQGLLPVICVGQTKGYRIETSDLESFLRQRRVQNEAAEPAKAPRPRLRHLKL